MAYKVVSASAVVKDKRGAQSIFYENDVLPDGLDEEHLKHLLNLGFIEGEGESKASAKSK